MSGKQQSTMRYSWERHVTFGKLRISDSVADELRALKQLNLLRTQHLALVDFFHPGARQ
jgi:hypothetical protein